MTQKEKKEYAALGVLVLATLLVIYFNFLKPKAPPLPANFLAVPGGSGAPAVGQNTGAPGAAQPGATFSSGPFLPNGPALDLKVLDDSRFRSLVPPTYPKVTPPEIGSTNPFGE
jgi:hypothetical protein